MTTTLTPDDATFVLEVLRVIADADDYESVTWRTDHRDGYPPVTFLVNCNDIFCWACGDAEPITPDNLPVLKQSYADERAALGGESSYLGALLFVARVRGLRPQGAAYPKDARLWPLFDACGPARDIDLGNPYTHPAEGRVYAYTEADTHRG